MTARRVEEAGALLVEALDDPVPGVRLLSAVAIDEMSLDAPLEALSKRAQDEDAGVRKAVVRALRVTAGEDANEAILGRLKDEDRDVRYEAAVMLHDTKDERAVEPLIECLRSDDEWLGHWVMQALGSIGDERSQPDVAPVFGDQMLGQAECPESRHKRIVTFRPGGDHVRTRNRE